MRIYRDPSDWPQAGLLPALLLRLTRETVERRLGERFAEFEDEGEKCAGLAFSIDGGVTGAIMIRETQEASPSVYLSAPVQHDAAKVNEVLGELRLSRNEVLDSATNTFSPSEIKQGLHLIRL